MPVSFPWQMSRLQSRRVLRPRLSLCPSILSPKACLLSLPHRPSPHPHPRRPSLLLLMPRALPDLLLLLPIRRTPHKPPWETVAPPQSNPFHGITLNWSCTPMCISQVRSFCFLLRRSRGHQLSPRFSGTSVVRAAGAAWTSASRRRRRHVAMNDAAQASLGVCGGCYRHPPLQS